MRHFLILLRHELRMLLISPTTYLAAFFFYTIMGMLYWSILREMVNVAQEDLPAIQFFKLFWLPTFFVVPLLTMRSIAGERSNGTLDTLMTTPASRGSIILSKFAGAYLFYMLLWFGTLAFPVVTLSTFPHIASADSLLQREAIIGSLSFIAISGALFISIGIFSSSITRSQLVAGMLSFTALFVVIVGGAQVGLLAERGTNLNAWMDSLVNYLQIFQHLDDFSRGVIDSRPFFYYLSTGLTLLGISTLVIEAKA